MWYKKSTAADWTQAQNYAANTSVSIKPGSTGTYDISVKVKDENGTIVKKALTVKVNAALKNTTTISSGSVKKGSSVTVNCSSTGGVGTKKYAVWYKKSTAADWTQAQNYATNTSVSIKPSYTGTYDVSVKVKDGDGTIVKKAFTVKVTA